MRLAEPGWLAEKVSGVKEIESRRKRMIVFFDLLKELKIQKVKKRLSIIPLSIYNSQTDNVLLVVFLFQEIFLAMTLARVRFVGTASLKEWEEDFFLEFF